MPSKAKYKFNINIHYWKTRYGLLNRGKSPIIPFLVRRKIVRTFEYLPSIRNLSFERHAEVEMALQYYAIGLDFADALHHSASLSCAGFASFDKKFERLAAKAKLNPVIAEPKSFTKLYQVLN